MKAYKAINPNNKASIGDFQFYPDDLDVIYTCDDKRELKVCTNTGFHYCNNFFDLRKYFDLRRSKVFEIEVLGEFLDDKDKSITKQFKFIRQLSKAEINDFLKKHAFEKQLSVVRELQKEYPVQVCGSTALFLHGIWLNRWFTDYDNRDIDLVVPYYMIFDKSENTSNKKSGNDFDYTLSIDDIKCDIKIDPKSRYTIVEYEGFKYRVADIYSTIEAKLKYAQQGNEKHMDDINEIFRLHKSNAIDIKDLF